MQEIAGLHFIAPGLGQLLGAVFAGIAMDKIFIALKKRHNGEGRPEFRVPLMLIASVLMPAGLFIYGWCGEYHTHWIGLDIGVMIFGFGTMVCFLALNTYLLDAFKYAASAVAATTVIRSIAGALFPLVRSITSLTLLMLNMHPVRTKNVPKAWTWLGK